MSYRVIIELDAPDQEMAETCVLAALELVKPQCRACNGERELYDKNGYARHCVICDGSGYASTHPYKPRVIQVPEGYFVSLSCKHKETEE